MTKKESIPDLLGEFSNFKLTDDLANKISDLYPHQRVLETKNNKKRNSKSRWLINERIGFTLPSFMEKEKVESKDSFCAIYHNKYGNPATIFLGNFKYSKVVDKSASILSTNVLEQRIWFANPPRMLTSGNGKMYFRRKGFEIGTTIAILGTAGLYLMIQSPGELDLRDYIIPYYCAVIAATITSLFSGHILGSLFGRLIGEAADNKRIKGLPPDAFSYSYGRDAENSINNEHSIIEKETRKIILYDRLRQEGYDVSKQFIAIISPVIKTLEESGNIDVISKYLKKKQEPKVPLETMINVYNAIE